MAITEASTNANIGAQITYQIDGNNTLVYGNFASEYMMQAKSTNSSSLSGSSGWSYGYYYHNNTLVHSSSDRMDFSF
jgi:hypothetical protein